MGTVSWRLWLHFPSEMIGVCHDDPDITAPEHVRYDAGVHLRRPFAPRGELVEQIIPGGRHAVFLHRGPHARLVETYDRIYGGWLPGAREELGEAPAFEVYLDHPERVAAEKLRTLIHVPLGLAGGG
jgi:AraC family transcriptional regulator